MAVKKIRIRPEGTNDYGDILHPETSADVVLLKDTAGNFSSNNVEGALAELYSHHVNNKNNPHAVTAAQVGAAPASHVGSGGSAHAVATTSVAGFMSAADKAKLNSIITTPHYQQFTTSGTWTKPPGINWVFVEVLGAGGGGSRGSSGSVTKRVGAGGGGGGGALSFALIPASTLPSTVSVVVGAGGAGGNSTNPSGSNGGSSSFAFVVAEGGKGSGRISGSEISWGDQGEGGISFSDPGLNGCRGGDGFYSRTPAERAGYSGVAGAGGGGGGAFYDGDVRGAGVGGSSSFLGTSGGNGGTASTTGNGGKGGNGGLGCGGGGGGTAPSGYTPGDGGKGGNGRVRVWAW